MTRPPGDTRPAILFVDDEPALLEAIRDALRRRYRIVTAVGAAAAIEELARQPFTVIVSDFAMPRMNGAQFLAHAKVVAPDSVRVLLTGHATFQDAVTALNQGNIFRFLSKPCPPDQLVIALDEAVEQARMMSADRDLLARKLDAMVVQLIRAERLASLGSLAGAVGHELTNAAAVLASTLEFARDATSAGQPLAAEDLAAFAHVSAQLTTHARNLLDLARLPAEEHLPTDASAVARSVCELLRASGIARRIELAVAPLPARALVELRAAELEQVLLNVLKNAVEATTVPDLGRTPRVHLALTVTDTHVRCEVTDNGVGIAADDQLFVFEPYFTTKAADSGTGLGLFVVRRSVERRGGRVDLESTAGAGTRIIIELPRAGAHVSAAADASR